MTTEREVIRAFHGEAGHSWPETAERVDPHVDPAKRRADRAPKERAAERAEVERKAREANELPLFDAS